MKYFDFLKNFQYNIYIQNEERKKIAVTKKQLKQLAKKLADYEFIIQTSQDQYKVNEAKNRISQLTESSDLDLEEMVKLDDMIQEMLHEKI